MYVEIEWSLVLGVSSKCFGEKAVAVDVVLYKYLYLVLYLYLYLLLYLYFYL